MTTLIDYLIRKQFTSLSTHSPSKYLNSYPNLCIIPQSQSENEYIRLINCQQKYKIDSKSALLLQNKCIESHNTNSKTHINPQNVKNFCQKLFYNTKHNLYCCPELGDRSKIIKNLQALSSDQVQKQAKSSNCSRNRQRLKMNLQSLRKISPFEKDLKLKKSKKAKPLKSSKKLKYTIQVIYSIPLKNKHNPNFSHGYKRANKYQQKYSREVIKASQNQIESQNHPQVYLYIETQTSDFSFFLKCYFADQYYQIIRVKDQHIINQIIYERFGLKSTDLKDPDQSSAILESMNIQPQVNPLTGQLFLHFSFLLLSHQIETSQLFKDCLAYLFTKSSQISQLVSQIQQPSHNKLYLQESHTKKQSILDECQLLLKANLFQNQIWISKSITRCKQIQKKLENQILMTYTFPKKLPQYEIMEDPFLKDQQKNFAINQLRKKQIQKLQLLAELQRLKPSQVQSQLINSKNLEFSRNFSDAFMALKKSLHQVNLQIQRCRIGKDFKNNHLLLKGENENRKRRHTVIQPVNINDKKDESIETLSFQTCLNNDLIVKEITKLKMHTGNSLRQGHPEYETIVKLKTVEGQKFYSLKLITISELQEKMQVERIVNKCAPVRSNSHKNLSLNFYLFDYKNLEAYSKWLCEEKIQKSQLINAFLSSEFSFPSKEFFASSKQFNKAYNTQSPPDFINSIQNICCPNSMPNIDSEKNFNIKSSEFSSVGVPEIQEKATNQLPMNLPYTKLYPNNFSSFGSLDWDKKYNKTLQKINMNQLPKNLLYQNRYIFSIRVASRTIRLGDYLQRNRRSLRFGKKVHIYKQIVEFYYILEYNGIDKEVGFGFQDICICKNLSVKIDCRLYEQNQVHQNHSSMYQVLLQIFLHIFLDSQYILNMKKLKQRQISNEFPDPNPLLMEQEKSLLKPFQIKEFDEYFDLLEGKDKVRQTIGICEKFFQLRYLRHYGDVTFLKLLFTLLKRYTDICPLQNQQIFKGEPTSVWLFLLTRKLHDYLQS